ncbi:LysR family transcriptional regulator [Microbacteriaceae bacterium K1510]|nr:LysR family transcriptional regulator [Microbacteriaceae bacterium K1510]
MKKPPEFRLPRLNRLRAFEGVRVAGAMSGAASRLHLTQPAITRSIRELEHELGATLFKRAAGGSFLTTEGTLFGRRTGRFFAQLNTAVADAVDADAASDEVARLTRKISDGHIHGLLAIAQAGNFRRAAQALGIAEPTLHRAARSLERLLGVALYRLQAGGISLSPAGAELARRFAVASVEIKAGLDELAAQRGSAATSMTIGLLVLAPKRLLSSAAEKVLESHPKARLKLREASYQELVNELRNGTIDVIFGALRAPPPFGDVREEALFEDPYCVVCRRNHPLARVKRPRRADLRAYDWIFPTASLPRRAVLDDLIGKWRLSSRLQIETDSLGAVTSLLAVSDRLSLLPRNYVFGEDRSAQLKILDVPVPHARRMVGLTTRRDWLPTALHAAFVDRLRDVSKVHRASAAPKRNGRAGPGHRMTSR